MSLITRTYTFTDGTTAYGSQVDSEVANIVNTLNSLDQANTTWTNVKVTTLLPLADVNLASHKITNLANGTVSTDAATYGQVSNLSPTGSITMFGAATAPTGWLLCDGSAVSRVTYSALFAVVSTSFGVGDGSSTFNLPSLKDKFIVGSGNTYTLAGSGGATTHTHTLTTSSNGAHTHTLATQGTKASVNLTSNYANVGTYQANLDLRASINAGGETLDIRGVTTDSQGAHTHTSTSDAGSTLPPYIALAYIIKT